MNIQESGEMYLETILILTKEKGSCRSIDIADHMNYSKPSVSRAVNLLKDEGYIDISAGNITLTPKGREHAEMIYERHLVLTDFLEKIGVNEEIAETDACRIEHVISAETLEAIRNLRNRL